MSLAQIVRDLFWNPATLAALPAFVLCLGLSAALGALIGHVYVRCGHSLSNRRMFARNFLLVAVTTTLIISIVKSSLALSLGLVGALSIIRFRAAIKEPEELAFLFLAISVGLGLGAGQALLTIIALVLILGFIVVRGTTRRNVDQPNMFLTVSAAASTDLTAGKILAALQRAGAAAALRRLDEGGETFDAAFAVDFPTVSVLERATAALREMSPGIRVSCLDDRGLGL